MTTYKTANSVGSSDPRDLYDNAQNLDELVNSDSKESQADRLGVSRKTWHGMEAAFDTAQSDRAVRYAQFLAASGYEQIGAYSSGLIVNEYNQIFEYSDSFYRLKPSVSLPFIATNWASDEDSFIDINDATLRQELDSDNGGDLVRANTGSGLQTVAEALNSRAIAVGSIAARDELPTALLNPGVSTVSVKGTSYIWTGSAFKPLNGMNPITYGAAGDGVTFDDTAFSALESEYTDGYVDLLGLTYRVATRPTANIYMNGKLLFESAFEPDEQELNQPDLNAIISAQTDTGGTDSIYDGGPENTPTESGRTNGHNRLVLACQNCRSSFVRSVNVGSIYSHAFGNVSGNYSARQSNAGAPQTVNMASEECEAYGFRGANIASIFTRMVASTGANIACRFGFNHATYSANLAVNTCRAGFGRDARLETTVSGGQVIAITVDKPGDGYTLNDSVTVIDRQAFGSGATAVIASVDVNGGITGVTVTNGGSGFNGNLRPTGGNYVDAYVVCEGNQIVNIASELSKAGVGDNVANLATRDVANRGSESAIVASRSGSSTAAGFAREAVIASSQGIASGNGAVVLSGQIAESLHDGAVVMGRRVASALERSLVLGDSVAGVASTANRKFQVTAGGNITAAGTISGSESYTDYAEYFENLDLGTIPLGILVALEGRRVRPTQDGDDILGVVSATALVAAGDSPFAWQGRYMTGEFGETIYEDVPMVRWELKGSSYDGSEAEAMSLFDEIPESAVRYTERHPIENPEYDPELENIPRSERPDEWTCVGLLGQVHVRVDDSVQAGDWVQSGTGGVGRSRETPTNMRCMEMRRPYSDDKGYAVAFCLIR